MKCLALAVATVLFGPSVAAAASGGGDCDLPIVKYVAELQAVLSRRAVDVVGSAAEGGPDTRLEQLVAPSAAFSMVRGDAVFPLGKGVSGARALAKEMKADSYRFLGSNYIPRPVEDRCASQTVEVEFTDTQEKYVYPVTFLFQAGRVISAEGWLRTYQTGPIPAARN